MIKECFRIALEAKEPNYMSYIVYESHVIIIKRKKKLFFFVDDSIMIVDCDWILAIYPCMNALNFNKDNSLKLRHERMRIAHSSHITVEHGANYCEIMISLCPFDDILSIVHVSDFSFSQFQLIAQLPIGKRLSNRLIEWLRCVSMHK